ncbi:hypothetical protein M0805_003968 [Coniferiporia weirii]|nr:hypothetical protein M0805_003968 [Coniferiporia weirii]
MSLPEYITDQFDLFDRNTSDESEWYGPINSLLGHLFPVQKYQIAPQYKGPVNPGSIDFTTLYVVRYIQGKSKHPVLFIEVKPAGHLSDLSNRAAADREMCERFGHLVEALVIPKLIGISTIGSRFSVYEFDKAARTLVPAGIAPHPDYVSDIAPIARWADDFLDSAEGMGKFLEITQQVRDMCNNL